MAGRAKRREALRVQAEKAKIKYAARRRKWLVALVFSVVSAIAIAAVVYLKRENSAPPTAALSPASPPSPQATNPSLPMLDQLIAMTPEQLAKVDIALVNLRCAEGLIGSENLDILKALATLDQWAEHVRAETERHFYRFLKNPGDYNNSEAYFRLLFMSNVMQQDLGIRYDLRQMIAMSKWEGPEDTFYDDSKNLFVHGLTEQELGTCSSLPVFYIALGRRLGYPLKLVAANGHYFVRWENNRSRLNFEATSPGFATYPDDYYRKWPLPISEKTIQEGYFLKSLTPEEVLVDFLDMRGIFLLQSNRVEEAMALFEKGAQLLPQSLHQQEVLRHYRSEYARYQKYQAAQAVSQLPFSLGGGDEGEQAARQAIIMSQQRRGEVGALLPVSSVPQNLDSGLPPNSFYNHPPSTYTPVPSQR